ncbi:MAG: aspartyl-tRNA(Asn)/glutamyl-tRNA (Gln) amidotransferase subunit A, partial [bacterium]
MDIVGLTIEKLHKAIKSKETTVTEVCQATFDRIEKLNPKLNAFLTLTQEKSLARAKTLDTQLSNGLELPTLFGVPVAVKDNMCTEGIRTTCGSKI